MQTLQAPLREGDDDYRSLEGASFRHRIQCREGHLVREVSRHTEKHQRIRMMRRRHQAHLLLAAAARKNPRSLRPESLITILTDTLQFLRIREVDRKPNELPNTSR